MRNNVLVLISTYNGEKYLRELFESILNQSNVDVDILIRDDGSSDKTMDIIREYSERKNIIFYSGENLGYAKSFWDLVKESGEYQFYAFCDQDDIWKTNKLEKAIEMINNYSSSDIPTLYTSGVISVNNNMEIISTKAFKCEKTLNIYESLQKSILPGCTFVFNNKAIQILRKYNGYMESHDWATYAIITAFGRVVFDSKSYINYRIHDNNAIGQNISFFQKNLLKIKRFLKKSKNTRSKFAKDFLECYAQMLPNDVNEQIKYLAYYKENLIFKFRLIFNNNFKGIIFKLYILMNRV